MTGIRLHSKHKLIVSLSLKTLAQLPYSEEAAKKIALEGPIPLLLVLINTLIKDPVVISEVFQPLSALCRSPDNAAAMAENVCLLRLPFLPCTVLFAHSELHWVCGMWYVVCCML